MKTFHFCYTVTPSESYDKEGNIKSADFWIDIRNQHSEIQAENLKEACQAFSEILSRDNVYYSFQFDVIKQIFIDYDKYGK